MGYINVRIDDEIEKKLRMEIARHGGKKGDLAKAVEEALKLWLEQEEKA